MNAVEQPSIADYRRHLLVCTGLRCTDDDESQTLFESLGAIFKATGLDQGDLCVKRSRGSCFAACRGEPTLCMQPDGIWCYNITPENLQRVVREHLVGGRPVEDLIFHRGPETTIQGKPVKIAEMAPPAQASP